MSPSIDASVRNCRRIAAGVPPSALRRPISRVRSFTDTNMMFMTPMPPTINDSAATPISNVVSVSSTDDVVSMTDCWVVIV